MVGRKETHSKDTLCVTLWRGDENGAWNSYGVPRRANQTVLDVVTWIQRNLDSSLAYRFACRVGMCGSCAMVVNGRPRWTCRTHVSRVAVGGSLEIGPLRHFPIIRDLAVDMTTFFEKWQAAGGEFHGSSDRNHPLAKVDPKSERRLEADLGIECINCAVCYAACEVVGQDSEYLGPAALNRAWTLQNDLRDKNRSARSIQLWGRGGPFTCHSHGNCTAHCPAELDPARSIAGLKRKALRGGQP